MAVVSSLLRYQLTKTDSFVLDFFRSFALTIFSFSPPLIANIYMCLCLLIHLCGLGYYLINNLIFYINLKLLLLDFRL